MSSAGSIKSLRGLIVTLHGLENTISVFNIGLAELDTSSELVVGSADMTVVLASCWLGPASVVLRVLDLVSLGDDIVLSRVDFGLFIISDDFLSNVTSGSGPFSARADISSASYHRKKI